MNLLAHHMEMGFIPIYLGQFCVGMWAGWQIVSGLSRYARGKSGSAAP